MSVWEEKKKSLLQTVCACSVHWDFHKICSISLTPARHADFSHMKDACHWSHSVWAMTKKQWRHSALHLQELSTGLSILAKCCSIHSKNKLVVLYHGCRQTGETVVMRGWLLELKTNCVRRPKGAAAQFILQPQYTDNPHKIFDSLVWFLTATLKGICNDFFTDVLGVVSVLWL